jgi:hypothetical protein
VELSAVLEGHAPHTPSGRSNRGSPSISTATWSLPSAALVKQLEDMQGKLARKTEEHAALETLVDKRQPELKWLDEQEAAYTPSASELEDRRQMVLDAVKQYWPNETAVCLHPLPFLQP